MVRTVIIWCTVGLSAWSPLVLAEEEVTLKSGARLNGTVTLDGQTVTVKIGDSQMTVPLSDVDSIGPAGSGIKQSPERMLMIALEARAFEGSGAGQVGLLAEAYRAAPEDARIAYWYAHSLVDAGFGAAAQEVLNEHLPAIRAQFPGMTERLTSRLQERLQLESLPPKLAQRLEKINQAAGNELLNTDEVPMFVRFRVIDSTGQPLDKSALFINCNGSDDLLDGYGLGHYLFAFNRHRSNSNTTCKLVINLPGFEPKECELQPASDHVPNAGDIVVQKYSDDDKVSLNVSVVDHLGKVVEGATVNLNTLTGNRNSTTTEITSTEGLAVFKAFPASYGYTVGAKDLKGEYGRVELRRGDSGRKELQVRLYPALSARIQITWSATSPQDVQETTLQETTLNFGEDLPPVEFHNQSMNIVRPIQSQNQLFLQFREMMYDRPGGGEMPSWVRKVPAELLKGSPSEYYKGIDLEKLDALQDELLPVESKQSAQHGIHPRGGFSVQQGEVYVGKIPNHLMRYRYGVQSFLTFKLFVEQLSSAAEAE